MRAWPLGAVLAAALALPAAADRQTERYERKRVEPGELVSRALGCRSGEATGGGYSLAGQPEDRVAFHVTASFPLADGSWRVDIRNVSGTRRPLIFRIYVLCTD